MYQLMVIISFVKTVYIGKEVMSAPTLVTIFNVALTPRKHDSIEILLLHCLLTSYCYSIGALPSSKALIPYIYIFVLVISSILFATFLKLARQLADTSIL